MSRWQAANPDEDYDAWADRQLDRADDARKRKREERAQVSEVVTGDDPVHCAICGKDTSIAMIGVHLAEHGYDPADLATAPVYINGELFDEDES